MMFKFLKYRKNTSSEKSVAFHKVYVQGDGVQADSCMYANELYISNWKLKCYIFPAPYTVHLTFWILNFYS